MCGIAGTQLAMSVSDVRPCESGGAPSSPLTVASPSARVMTSSSAMCRSVRAAVATAGFRPMLSGYPALFHSPAAFSRPHSVDGTPVSCRGLDGSGSALPAAANSSVSPQDFNLQQSNLALLRAELKLVTHDRDGLRKELRKMSSEREEALKRLGVTSKTTNLTAVAAIGGNTVLDSAGASVLSDSRNNSPLLNLSALTARVSPSAPLPDRRSGLELAESERLRRQLVAAVSQHEAAAADAEYSRCRHRVTLTKLEAVAAEAGALRSQYADVCAQRDRLHVQLQHGPAHSPPSPDSDQLLRSRYDELVAAHAALSSRLELSQSETERLRRRLDDALAIGGSGDSRQRDNLKQQCSSAIRQWDIALRERNEYRDMYVEGYRRQEELAIELDRARAAHLKATKETRSVNQERNAALLEINRILAERDVVHAETTRLQEDCLAAERRVALLSQQNNELSVETEALRCEISSALAERDHALRLANELPSGERSPSSSTQPGPRTVKSHGNIIITKYRSKSRAASSSIDRAAVIGSQRCGEKSKDSVDSVGVLASCESGRAGEVETGEVSGSGETSVRIQQLERQLSVSRRRRDWAFSERDKLLRERESVRQLCDQLRRDRDRAVSERTRAVHDSDSSRKMIAQLTAAQHQQTSRGSYQSGEEEGADMLECGSTEGEWVQLKVLVRSTPVSRDACGVKLEMSDSVPTVRCVSGDSVFAGSLMAGDRLLSLLEPLVDRKSRRLSSVEEVFSGLLQDRGVCVVLLVERQQPPPRSVLLPAVSAAGVGLQHGLYVSHVQAAVRADVCVGDRLLAVNGRPVSALSEALLWLAETVSAGSPTQLLLQPDVSGAPVRAALCSSPEGAPGTLSSPPDISRSSSSSITSSGPPGKPKKYNSGGGGGFVRNRLAFVRDIVLRGAGRSTVAGKGHSRPSSSSSSSSSTSALTTATLSARSSGAARAELDAYTHQVLSEFNAVLERADSGALSARRELASVDRDPTRPSLYGGPGASVRRQHRPACSHGTWPRCVPAEPNSAAPPGPQNQARDCHPAAVSSTVAGSARFPRHLLSMGSSTAAATATLSRSWYRQSRQSSRTPVRIPLSALVADTAGNVNTRLTDDRGSCTTADVNSVSSVDTKDTSAVDFGRSGAVLHGRKVSRRSVSPSSTTHNNDIDLSVKSVKLDGQSLVDYYSKRALNGVQPPVSMAWQHQQHVLSMAVNDLPESVSGVDADRGIVLQHSGTGAANPSPSGVSSRYVVSAVGTRRNSMGSVGECFDESNISGSSSFSFDPSNTSPPSHLPLSFPSSSSLPEGPESNQPTSWRGDSAQSPDPVSPSTRCSHVQSTQTPSTASVQSLGLESCGSALGERSCDALGYSAPDYSAPRFIVRTLGPRDNRSGSASSDPSVVDTVYISHGQDQQRGAADGRLTSGLLPLSPGVGGGRPAAGDVRHIVIERSQQPLGISIRCHRKGGVFVSAVTPNSLADQVQLEVGDQILEVCGINLRTATRPMAVSVLSQCGDSRRILVQYQPQRYRTICDSVEDSDGEGAESSRCSDSGADMPPSPLASLTGSHSLGQAQLPAPGWDTDSASSTLRAPLLSSGVGNIGCQWSSPVCDEGDALGRQITGQPTLTTLFSQQHHRSHHQYCQSLHHDYLLPPPLLNDRDSLRRSNTVLRRCSPLTNAAQLSPSSVRDGVSRTVGIATATHVRSHSVADPATMVRRYCHQDIRMQHQPQQSHQLNLSLPHQPQQHFSLLNQAHQQQTEEVSSTTDEAGPVCIREEDGNSETASDTDSERSLSAPQSDRQLARDERRARYVRLRVPAGSPDLGIQLVGGNSVGIYVYAMADSVEVLDDSRSQCDVINSGCEIAASVCVGCRLLEFNGTDLRAATAEQAAAILARPVSVGATVIPLLVAAVSARRFRRVCRRTCCDRVCVRALFDFQPVGGADHQWRHLAAIDGGDGRQRPLAFRRHDILLVESTMYGGRPGVWRAWLLDGASGRRRRCGLVPSKLAVDSRLLGRGPASGCSEAALALLAAGGVSLAALGGHSSDPASSGGRIASLSIRRSFFRRKSTKHLFGDSSSQSAAGVSGGAVKSDSDSLLLAESCDNYWSPGQQADCPDSLLAEVADCQADGRQLSYQRVERIAGECSVRPVLLLGPLTELVAERLASEWPQVFSPAPFQLVPASQLADAAGRRGPKLVSEDWCRQAMSCDDSLLECSPAPLGTPLSGDRRDSLSRQRQQHVAVLYTAAVAETGERLRRHCLLPVQPSQLETLLSRLRLRAVHPIILLLRFSSAKQLRQARAAAGAAKQPVARQADKRQLELWRVQERRGPASAVVPADADFTQLCVRVRSTVQREQDSCLWAPRGSL